MKFLIDAQLPPAISVLLKENGMDSIHTMDLPEKNQTSDMEICRISIRQERIVVTKDVDFYHSLLIRNEPYKLILVRVGNMGTRELTNLIARNLENIVKALEQGRLVELYHHKVRAIY